MPCRPRSRSATRIAAAPVARARALGRVVALAGGAALAAACGHSPIPMMGDYPAVESSAGNLLVAGTDTLWSDAVGPVALVTRDRAILGRAWPELSGSVRAHQRMFGIAPVPVTVLLVSPARRARDRSAADSAAARDVRALSALLPDSLARRAKVWYAIPPDRRRRDDMAPGERVDTDEQRIVMRWEPLAPQVAQRWVAARASVAAGGADALPPWLHAGLVGVLGGGGELRAPRGVLERRDRDLVPLDTLFARRCESGWQPVRLLDPSAPMPSRQRADDAARDDRGARCGPRFQAQAQSVLAFMMQRAGDPVADALLRAALRGDPVERVLAESGRPAGRSGLPPTVRELEVAWRAWVREQWER